MEEEIEELLGYIEDILYQRRLFEHDWIGRLVRLTEPFGRLSSPAGEQVLLDAGTIGWIVNLRMDSYAPFIIEFSGFPYRIAPALEKLELLD